MYLPNLSVGVNRVVIPLGFPLAGIRRAASVSISGILASRILIRGCAFADATCLENCLERGGYSLSCCLECGGLPSKFPSLEIPFLRF